MNVDTPRTIVTILGYGISVDIIAAFVLGLIPYILLRVWNRRHYPSRLFKTQFDPNRYYEKKVVGNHLSLDSINRL